MKKRIGTDLFITINILKTDGTAADLSNIYDDSFVLYNNDYPITSITQNVTISGNQLSFLYSSVENTILGTFNGLFQYKVQDTSSETGYILYKIDVPNIFTIVSTSTDETSSSSTISYTVTYKTYS